MLGSNTHMNSVIRVNRDRLKKNFESICSTIGPYSMVLPVIKSDAYGHGAFEVARALLKAGAQRFAVASLDEAVSLRQAGIKKEIVILFGLRPGEEADAASANLVPMIQTVDQLLRWQNQANRTSKILQYHVEIDSGMTRLGFDSRHIDKLVTAIKSADRLHFTGIATHLAAAQDFSSTQTIEQLESFSEVLDKFSSENIAPKVVHIANSAALAYRPNLAANMVRPGLALYGYVVPSKGKAPTSRLEVKPILEWTAPIISVRDVAKGALIGYDGSYRASEHMRIGVVGVGYADGFDRRLSMNGEMLVQGKICPVVGLISMNLTTIDLRSVSNVTSGDQATLIDDNLDANTLAARCQSSPYEVLCGISPHIARKYT